MDRQRWQQVEKLYHDALAVEPERRLQYLREACGNDADLCQEAESLLAWDQAAEGELLDQRPWSPVALPETLVDELQFGSQVGPYLINSLLGSGGMGQVFRGEDRLLRRPVAIKTLRNVSGATAQARLRFLQEARAASALNHPNIVQIYELRSNAKENFIVMEFVRGRSLAQVLASRSLSIDEVISYAGQIADALAAAHDAGITHRDIKPGNILITEDGRVKIIDFGIAKLREPASETSASPETVSGALIGTVQYMSPEQAEGKPVDARSDIFSFGTVLYEMLAGCRPFDGESMAQTLTRIVRDQPKPIRNLRQGIPAKLIAVVDHCLAKVPAKRYASGRELRAALTDSLVPLTTREYRWTRPILALGVITALGVSGWLTYLGRGATWFRDKTAPNVVEKRRAADATQVALNPEPLTSYPGAEKQPSLSPDGSQVAFVWTSDKDQNARIYVQLAGGQGSPIPLTAGLKPEFSPSWSPNGELIAFCRQVLNGRQSTLSASETAGAGQDAEIVVIPARGGSERIVARSTKDWFPACDENWPVLTWFPNSDAIAVAATQDGPERGSSSIWLVSIDGKRRQALTTPSPQTAGDRLPSISPDGKLLAFVRSLNRYWVAHEIYVLALDAENRAQGVPDALLHNQATNQAATARQSQVTGLAWMPGERHQLLFTRRGLWRAAVDSGGEASYVPLGASDPRALSVSKDGQHLVFSSGYWDLDVWRMPGPTAQGRTDKAEGKPFLAGTRLDTNPQYSADGTKLAFTSMRTGMLQVWVADSDGGNPLQVTKSETATGSPHWSPDGRYIAFDSVPASSEKGGIYVIPSAGGPVRRFTASESHAHLPSWSADGRWIYFESDRNGRMELWKQEFPSGRAEPVASDGAAGAFESPDGEWIYYSRRTKSGLWRKRTAGGGEEQVSDRGNPLFWGFYKQGICLLDPDPERVQVKCGRLQDTRFAVLTSFANGGHVRPTGPSFAVSPDGKWVLYTRIVREETDLMMVDHLAAALSN